MKQLLPILTALLLSVAACKKEESTDTIRFCPNIYAQYSYENNGDTAYCWVPNMFSPDGNGLNEHFFACGYNINPTGNIIVKKGNVTVYQNDSILGYFESGWDGYSNGVKMADGNYDYTINGADIYGHSFTLTGTISLVDSIFWNVDDWMTNSVNCDSCRTVAQWDGRIYNPILPTGEFLDGRICEEY